MLFIKCVFDQIFMISAQRVTFSLFCHIYVAQIYFQSVLVFLNVAFDKSS